MSSYKGTAETVRLVSDERGFELWLETGDGEAYGFNVHGCAPELFEQVKRIIGSWLDDAMSARRLYLCNPDESAGMADEYAVAIREDGSLRMERDEDAYDPTDPKHRDWHSIHADIWDLRAGK